MTDQESRHEDVDKFNYDSRIMNQGLSFVFMNHP